MVVHLFGPKDNREQYVPPSRSIEHLDKQFPEGNTSDGGEFLDDAIHMEEEAPTDLEE